MRKNIPDTWSYGLGVLVGQRVSVGRGVFVGQRVAVAGGPEVGLVVGVRLGGGALVGVRLGAPGVMVSPGRVGDGLGVGVIFKSRQAGKESTTPAGF